MESKIVNSSLETTTSHSTYKNDFVSDERELSGITKITGEKRSRKIYDPTIAPLKELLVMSCVSSEDHLSIT